MQRLDVLLVRLVCGAPGHRLDVPAVALVPGKGVLGEGDAGVTFDADLVVVPDQHEVAQLLGPGQAAGLGGDPFLQVPVGGHAPNGVVEHGLARRGVRVEQTTFATRGHGHPNGVGDALSQRPGGGLHAGGVAVLGVAGCQRAPLPQVREVLEREAVTRQVQLRVQRDAGVTAGQDEAVAARPGGVGRVVAKQSLEQQVRRGCQSHGGAGVT